MQPVHTAVRHAKKRATLSLLFDHGLDRASIASMAIHRRNACPSPSSAKLMQDAALSVPGNVMYTCCRSGH